MRLAHAIVLLWPVLAGGALAQSVWLPTPGRMVLTPSFTYQTFDRFWMGAASTSLPRHVPQRTYSLSAEYGIRRRWAADVTAGHTSVRTAAFGESGRDSGMSDTLVGVRYLVVEQSGARPGWIPSLALRAGAIAAGTYRPNFPFSAGDGASGGEASLLWGRTFSDGAMGAYGDAGYRRRTRGVPADWFGSAGFYRTLRRFSLSAGYRQVSGISGMDIGDPGFTFPRLKEVSRGMEFGVGAAGKGVYYQFFSAHVLGGRNTGAKLVVGVSATFGFTLFK